MSQSILNSVVPVPVPRISKIASATTRLYELSCGVPRRVAQLADLALLAGAGLELEQVDAATVESAYQELGVLVSPPAQVSTPAPIG